MNRRERLGATIDKATTSSLDCNRPLQVNRMAEPLESDVRPDNVGCSARLGDLNRENGSEPRSVPIERLRVVRRLVRKASRVQTRASCRETDTSSVKNSFAASDWPAVRR